MAILLPGPVVRNDKREVDIFFVAMSVQAAALGAVLRVGRVWIGIAGSLLLKVPVPPGRTPGLEGLRCQDCSPEGARRATPGWPGRGTGHPLPGVSS